MTPWQIIGIDCAVDEKNVAVARGYVDEGLVRVTDAIQCGKRSPADVVCEFAEEAKTILAFDAPLGWPSALGAVLINHRAGAELSSYGHALFRRTTDIIVKRETGQQPLDVGADRIARTAAAALSLLGSIRERLERPVALAWNHQEMADISAIEVYPAATLRRLGVNHRSYKKPIEKDREARVLMVEALARSLDLRAVREAVLQSADALDAAVCVLAAADFLAGNCRVPSSEEREVAEKEGWIWFRQKPPSQLQS